MACLLSYWESESDIKDSSPLLFFSDIWSVFGISDLFRVEIWELFFSVLCVPDINCLWFSVGEWRSVLDYFRSSYLDLISDVFSFGVKFAFSCYLSESAVNVLGGLSLS